jgi:raffinose/stachyose/melibiose transport system permease protein
VTGPVPTAAAPVAERPQRFVRRGRAGARAPSQPRAWVAYAWIAPAVSVFALFALAPLVHTIWLSFFDWDGVTTGTWTGLENYRAILSDPQLRATLLHPLVLIVFYSALPTALALVLTGIVVRIRLRGLTVYRALLFMPQIIATVAIATAFRGILDNDGPVNAVLRAVGLGSLARAWLGDFTWALYAVGSIGTWIAFGFCFVLFLAGAQKIPRDLYDAARVDGAPAWREFFAVTVPGLRREIVFAVVLTLIAALRTFDITFVLTQGGPGLSTSVPSYEVYRQAFQEGAVGRAAAFGVALTIIIMVIVIPISRLGREER